jgi:hypothetical protein
MIEKISFTASLGMVLETKFKVLMIRSWSPVLRFLVRSVEIFGSSSDNLINASNLLEIFWDDNCSTQAEWIISSVFSTADTSGSFCSLALMAFMVFRILLSHFSV